MTHQQVFLGTSVFNLFLKKMFTPSPTAAPWVLGGLGLDRNPVRAFEIKGHTDDHALKAEFLGVDPATDIQARLPAAATEYVHRCKIFR